MIAVLALFAGIVAASCCNRRSCSCCSRTCPSRWWRRSTRCSAASAPPWTGSSTTNSSSSRSSPTSWWRRSSCTRRPARRRRPALDRRRGRPRRTDLRQRGGHPPPRVQGVSGMPDDEPRPDQSDRADQARGPQPVAPVRGRGDHRPAGRSARVRARRAGPQQHRRHPAGERPPGRPGADPVRPQQPRTAPAIGHHRPGADPGPARRRAQGREAALAEARRRADELGILAGTIPAEGGWLVIRIQPGDRPIRSATVLEAVEELRGAGAEAIQIGGGSDPAVRVVASTYFEDGPDGRLVVDGRGLRSPYSITVIGPAATMKTALTIPGGVSDAVGRTAVR